MNNNKKDNFNNQDETDIRSHLDASLEKSGISVSEELIQKTLKAIKEQSGENAEPLKETKGDSSRILHWNRYIRSIAGVAAAAFIIVIGYQTIKYFNHTESKEDKGYTSHESAEPEEAAPYVAMDARLKSTSSKNDVAYNEEAAESDQLYANGEESESKTAEDTNKNSADKSAAMEEKEQTDTLKDEKTSAKESEYILDNGAGSASDSTGKEMTPLGITESAFADIIPLTLEQINQLIIINVENNQRYSTMDSEIIKGFYDGMNSRNYTVSEKPKSSLYNIELISEDTQVPDINISIGDTMLVTIRNGEEVTESSFLPDDTSDIIKLLEQYFK